MYVIGYPNGFLKALVGTSMQGKAKIRQPNALDAFYRTNSSSETRIRYINLCLFLILCLVEPRYNEGNNVFVITRFRYIEFFFSFLLHLFGVKKIVRCTKEVPLYLYRHWTIPSP